MPDLTPLEVLARNLIHEKSSRELAEDALERTPRWRFRRRRDIEHKMDSHRAREESLLAAVGGRSNDSP